VNTLTLVTGKGGVGKTRTSLLLAEADSRACLTETAPGLQEEAQNLGLKPKPILRFERSDLYEDFLASALKFPPLAKWLMKAPLFHSLLQLAPNLQELLTFSKWLELAEEQPLVVDAPATGHFLAYFQAIHAARNIFDGGTLKALADRAHKYLDSAESIEIVIVALPEHSALEEMKQIEEGVLKLYPHLKIRRILNRLHLKPETTLALPPNLKLLAEERPKREQQRAQDFNRPFEKVIAFGDRALSKASPS